MPPITEKDQLIQSVLEYDCVLAPEMPEHEPHIEALVADVFGPGRFVKAASALREQADPAFDMSFVALDPAQEGKLIGSVRLTKIMIGKSKSLLLGPIVVDQPFKGLGIGRALMVKSMDAAEKAAKKRGAQYGRKTILLIGDYGYYSRFGFQRVKPGSIELPRPADPARILIYEFETGAADKVSGVARGQAAAMNIRPKKARKSPAKLQEK